MRHALHRDGARPATSPQCPFHCPSTLSIKQFSSISHSMFASVCWSYFRKTTCFYLGLIGSYSYSLRHSAIFLLSFELPCTFNYFGPPLSHPKSDLPTPISPSPSSFTHPPQPTSPLRHRHHSSSSSPRPLHRPHGTPDPLHIVNICPFTLNLLYCPPDSQVQELFEDPFSSNSQRSRSHPPPSTPSSPAEAAEEDYQCCSSDATESHFAYSMNERLEHYFFILNWSRGRHRTQYSITDYLYSMEYFQKSWEQFNHYPCYFLQRDIFPCGFR